MNASSLSSDDYCLSAIDSGLIDHFVCPLCSYIVYEPKECPNCQQLYCFKCQQSAITARN
jgi:hypothetical protein